MASRFYVQENGTPEINPAVDASWESNASPFARRPLVVAGVSGDLLTTVTGFTSTTGQDRCHRQGVSKRMNAGFVFGAGTTFKAYFQCLESAANDNIRSRLGLRVLSEDGATVRKVLAAVADYSTGTEWATSLRNKRFADGDAGAAGDYTTVQGDRFVVEVGHNDAAGSTISGSSRWGADSAATDVGENETDTGTTLRGWVEISLNLTFVPDPPPPEIYIVDFAVTRASRW